MSKTHFSLQKKATDSAKKDTKSATKSLDPVLKILKVFVLDSKISELYFELTAHNSLHPLLQAKFFSATPVKGLTAHHLLTLFTSLKAADPVKHQTIIDVPLFILYYILLFLILS